MIPVDNTIVTKGQISIQQECNYPCFDMKRSALNTTDNFFTHIDKCTATLAQKTVHKKNNIVHYNVATKMQHQLQLNTREQNKLAIMCKHLMCNRTGKDVKR